MPCLATTTLTVIAVMLNLPAWIITVVAFFAANIAAFCELVRPETLSIQIIPLEETSSDPVGKLHPHSFDKTQPQSVDRHDGASIQPETCGCGKTFQEPHDDDNTFLRSDDSESTLVGSLSLKSLAYSTKSAYYPLITNLPLELSVNGITEFRHDDEQPFLSYDSEDEEETAQLHHDNQQPFLFHNSEEEEETAESRHDEQQPFFFYDSEDEEETDEEECNIFAYTNLNQVKALPPTSTSGVSITGFSEVKPITKPDSPREKSMSKTTWKFDNADEDEDKAEDKKEDEVDDNTESHEENEDEDDDDNEAEEENENGDDHDEEEESNEFAEVMRAVNLQAVKRTALICRAKELTGHHAASPGLALKTHDLSCEIASKPMFGSNNLVYIIQFSDGVKWVVRLPRHGCRFAILDATKMESEYATMELIRRNTTMPIPQVYFHTWMSHRAGVPFALMAYIEGKMLFKFWHAPSTTEEQKLATLTSIARYMAELSTLTFPERGILYIDECDQVPCVGPAIESVAQYPDDVWGASSLKPQYKSIKEALTAWLEDITYNTKSAESDRPLLTMAIESIPDFMEGKNYYAISPPDFDSQNIMLNDDGAITGFLDWDLVEVSPLSIGAGKFPMWLTRDWQPGSYEWENENGDKDKDEAEDEAGKEDIVGEDSTDWKEDSPEQLSLYRRHYLDTMTKYQGPNYDTRWTKLSHILETISVGVYDESSAGDNVERLFQHAGIPFELSDYADAYVNDDVKEKDRMIREAFKKMWHAEWEEEEMGEDGETGMRGRSTESAATRDAGRNLEALRED